MANDTPFSGVAHVGTDAVNKQPPRGRIRQVAIEVSCLADFIAWIEELDTGQYLFRGVPDESFEILASTYLRLSPEERNSETLLRINEGYIRDARLRGHDLKNGQQLSDLELLAELQHFRAATCLIDFTYSAHVALWFACERSANGPANGKVDPESNGKVYAVRIDNTQHNFAKITPALLKKDLDHFFTVDEGDRLYQWQPKQQNNRIVAQQSVFLFGGAEIDADAECVIQKSSKQVILTSLEKSSGIMEARLFPDFDGFARLRAHNKPYSEPDALNHFLRGVEAVREGDLDSAIVCYSAAINLKPDYAEAYFNRGNAYEEKGEIDLAIEDYKTAIQLNPRAS